MKIESERKRICLRSPDRHHNYISKGPEIITILRKKLQVQVSICKFCKHKRIGNPRLP